MTLIKRIPLPALCFLLAACSLDSGVFTPAPQGQAAQAAPEAQAQPPQASDGAAPVRMTEDEEGFAPASSASSPTGTFAGQKIATLRTELGQLEEKVGSRQQELQSIRRKIAEDARLYYELVATINARLQVGTTSGNPILNEKWRQASVQLDAISQDVAQMYALSAKLNSDAGMSAYIIDSAKGAFSISGAVDEDHELLRQTEGEAMQTSIKVERMANEVNLEVNRQQQYLAMEKKNLSTLSMAIRDGQLYGAADSAGGLMGSQPAVPAAPAADPKTAPASAAASSPIFLGKTPVPSSAKQAPAASQKPLMVIRFDKRTVPYEQALFQAVKRTLDKKEDASFSVVGVAPTSAAALQKAPVSAKQASETVYRALLNMGLPESRLELKSGRNAQAKVPEVQIFVR